MSTPAVVAVCGSCPTRDNFNSEFNPGYRDHFVCEAASNQVSMVALMSPPFAEFDDIGAPPTMSDYDRWNVRSDLTREFLGLLAATRPDYLVVDFFADVHFGFIELDDGRYLTDNRWKLHRTDLYRRLETEGRIARRWDLFTDTDEYVAIWRAALDRFAAYVAEHCPDTRVVVHRGWNTEWVLTPRRPRPMRLQRYKAIRPFDVERGNELWARLDDHCVEQHGWDQIDLRAERCPTSVDHPWGPFWVHYTPDYYHRFLAELHKIHLRRSGLDADVLDRIALIETAATEPVARRLTVQRAVNRRLRAQLSAPPARPSRPQRALAGLARLRGGRRTREPVDGAPADPGGRPTDDPSPGGAR
jgi:hypothetical protein